MLKITCTFTGPPGIFHVSVRVTDTNKKVVKSATRLFHVEKALDPATYAGDGLVSRAVSNRMIDRLPRITTG
ncbi:MAG: hypothetical protein ABSA63_07535 [Thermoplasmata archaeon]